MRPAHTLALAGLATVVSATCESMCGGDLQLSSNDTSLISCTYYTAGSTFNIDGGQSACTSSATPEVDICRIVLSVATSEQSDTYIEVWLPSGGETSWNGRMMATDNGGVGGCVAYDDMTYTSSLGFAVVGDNGGHNTTSYDGSAFLNNNDIVLDWSYRGRHAAVVAGKQVIEQYYSYPPNYSYYLGCSTGGRQGLKSAQTYPEDFDGIIAGSAATDFNHLSDFTGRFVLMTGSNSSDPRFLTYDQWALVHAEVLSQCDEALDGVADGIIEDPTICNFNPSPLQCANGATSDCLTSTQISTVWNIFSQLYDQNGLLLFPGLSPGAELQSAAFGVITGKLQGTSTDWFRFGVYNNASWDPYSLSQNDYTEADKLDDFHGNVSSYSGDLSSFRNAGAKLLMYHGQADPVVPSDNSQRYYLKVASQMGLDHTDLDDFLRYFRVSGGSHCSSGGAGAWAFGQSGPTKNATDSVIDKIVAWVERGVAPDTLNGTKWNNDDPAQGVAFERAHCRFPYRTTFRGGNPNVTDSWTCEYIDNWQECGPGATPRLCGSGSDPTAF